jgi:hypothetical protein
MSFSLVSGRIAAAAALALVFLGTAFSAHARSDVSFSIGIHMPGAYVQPAPVYAPHRRIYYQPQPVYVQPRPVFVQPRPVFVQPRPVFVQPRPVFVQPRPVFVQPRPVFVQPPAHGGYYRSRPDWRSTHWERNRKHGHQRHNGLHGGQLGMR